MPENLLNPVIRKKGVKFQQLGDLGVGNSHKELVEVEE